MKNNIPIYFVIGTRAQFIKVAPLMREMLNQKLVYTLINTAQHRENIDDILNIYNLPAPNIMLNDSKETDSQSSFLLWFLNTLYKVLFESKKYINKPGILLTHGDTFTAWLAALMGKRAGCCVGHIESGCRSFNIFSPFPEEISRLITFRFTDIFFCANEWAINNLKHYKGLKINLEANTLLDGVRFAINYQPKKHFDFEDSPFVIVSIHRYENIFTARFSKVILPLLLDIARNHHLIITLHPTTRERLKALSWYERLNSHPNITLHERFGFVEWIDLCNKAEFVISDGGSNQEELSYLGVPTLLFRNESERQEGLGQNIIISKFDKTVIYRFISNLDQYRKKPEDITAQPSLRIIQTICDLQSGIWNFSQNCKLE